MIDPLSVLNRVYNHSSSIVTNNGSPLPFLPMVQADNALSNAGSVNIKEKSLTTDMFVSINVDSMDRLLQLQFIPFISYMSCHEPLKRFIKSYLTQRNHSIVDILRSSDLLSSHDPLHDIDKRVILLYHRMLHDNYSEPISPHLQPSLVQVYQPKSSDSNAQSGMSYNLDDYRLMMSQQPLLSMPYVMDLIVLLGDDNLSLATSILRKSFYYRSNLKKDFVNCIKETSKVMKQLVSSLTAKPSKANSSASTSTVYRQVNKSNKQQVDDEMAGLSLDDSLYFVGDIIQTWSSFIIAGCGDDEVYSKSEGKSSSSSHPLSAVLCGNMTGLTSYGLELLSIVMNIYEVVLPRLLKGFKSGTMQSTANNTSNSSAKNSFNRIPMDDNTASKVIIGLRKRILQMIDALVKLSINQLTGLPQSEVLMLRMSDWTMEGNCSWLEWMERVLTHEMAGDSSTQAGALVSDYITVFEDNIRSLLLLCSIDDDGIVETILESCKALNGFTSRKQETVPATESITAKALSPVRQTSKQSIMSSKPPSRSSSKSAAASAKDIDNELASTLKNIFPSYGRAFLLACLKTFNMDIERTTDALVTDNLPSHLQKMDRRSERVQIGKSSLERAFSDEQNKSFLEIQKARIRASEAEDRENIRVLSLEYNDDYDDQYDIIMGARVDEKMAGEDEEEGEGLKSKRKSKKKEEPKIDWEVRMRDTKRLNNLIFAEEEEQRFWESMRNTNYDRPVKGIVDGEDNQSTSNSKNTKNAKAGKKPDSNKSLGHQKEDSKHQKLSSKDNTERDRATMTQDKAAKSAASTVDQAVAAAKAMQQMKLKDSSESGDKMQTSDKPRTKHYDKHHQKDRAYRKMGGGF